MNSCPYCNKVVTVDTRWCPHCGNPLPAQTEASISERIENLRNSIFGLLRILLNTAAYLTLCVVLFTLFLQKYLPETIPHELEPDSSWLSSLIESGTTNFVYLYKQYGNLLQFVEAIISLVAIAFGFAIFWFLGIFEPIFGLSGKERKVKFFSFPKSQALDAKVIESEAYGIERGVMGSISTDVLNPIQISSQLLKQASINLYQAFPFECISLTIKINNKNGGERYIRSIKLQIEFISSQGLLEIGFFLKDRYITKYSYTPNRINLLLAMVIIPLRNAAIHFMPKLKRQSYMSLRAYAMRPFFEMKDFEYDDTPALTTGMFDRYTNHLYNVSEWVDMCALSDIFFLNIVVKFSADFLSYLRKYQFTANHATIHVYSDDASTILTKSIEFISPTKRKDEYARIQQLISPLN